MALSFPFSCWVFCIVLYFGFHVYLAYPRILSLFHWLSPCRTKYLGTNAPNVSSLRYSAPRSSRVPDTVRGRRTTFVRFHLEHITDRSKVKNWKKGRKQVETREKNLKKHQKKISVAFLESEILSKFLGGPWNPRSERIPQDALLKHKCIENVLWCVLISAANHDSCFTPSWFWNFFFIPFSFTDLKYSHSHWYTAYIRSQSWLSGIQWLCKSLMQQQILPQAPATSRVGESPKSCKNPVLHRQL